MFLNFFPRINFTSKFFLRFFSSCFILKNKLHSITFFLLLFVANSVFAETIIVCKTCSIKTITEGINLASDGDTVLVKEGIYKEANIKINKSITLLGEGLPTIDGEQKGEIITIGANNVTLDGFKIMNVGVSYTTDYAAVRVVNSTGFTIQNLELEKLFFGI